MIVYNKYNGDIYQVLPKGQDKEIFFHHYSEEFKETLTEIDLELPLGFDKNHYKIINGQLIKRDAIEIKEIEVYRRILTEEERILESMKPSIEEVREAEQTIRILTLIQEVM